MIKLEGKYNNAKIMIDNVEQELIGKVTKAINSEAFEGTHPVVMMPDAHFPLIGLTFPLNENSFTAIPSAVSYDIGCGVRAVDLGDYNENINLDEVDKKIRQEVPVGKSVNDRENSVHLKNEFPFNKATKKLRKMEESLQTKLYTDWFEPNSDYDFDYVEELCNRVNADLGRVVASTGSNGGGNHFMSLAVSQDSGNLFNVIHTGSRVLGARVGSHWQDRAGEMRDIKNVKEKFPEKYKDYVKFDINSISDNDLYKWLTGQFEESYLRKEKIRDDFSGRDIQTVFNKLTEIFPDSNDSEFNYLEDEESYGYLIDLIFTQTYAEFNREITAKRVAGVLDREIENEIDCTHNFIDPEDLVLRKGATPAREGQKGVIPLNMKDGTVIFEGKGNEEWNNSVNHGAGRTMSRREAKDTIDEENVKEEMKDIFSSNIPLDEAPDAYKSSAMIKEAIEPTAEVIDHLTPVLNVKA